MSAVVYAVASQKGGVGKTTITANLGAVAADAMRYAGFLPTNATVDAVVQSLLKGNIDTEPEEDSPVLVVDTDPQRSSDFWQQQIERQGRTLPYDVATIEDPLDLLRLKQARSGYIFVDTPGSLEAERTLELTLKSADYVIVPMITEGLCFEPTKVTIEKVIKPSGIPFIVVVNNWEARDGKVDLAQTVEFIQAMGWPFANTVIRKYKIHTRASVDGMVVTQYAKSRATMEAREDFFRLGLELGLGGNRLPAPRKPSPRPRAVTTDHVGGHRDVAEGVG